MVTRVDLGLFVRNDAGRIVAMMQALRDQAIGAGIDLQVHVLAYGCDDDTVARAQWAAPEGFRVHDLTAAGKSQTWNRFVHDLSRRNADILIFCDAGIGFPAADCLSRLIHGLRAHPDLHLRESQPVREAAQGLFLRLTDASKGGPDAWQTAACGQLYAMPAVAARRNILPIGLPLVEGFLRAMVVTDRFTAAEDPLVIDRPADLFHLCPPAGGMADAVRSQTRLVVGSAVNAAVFRHLAAEGEVQLARGLSRAAADETWLHDVLRRRLPRLPYLYVPLRFLFQRLTYAPRRLLHPKRLGLALFGFGFDAIVYLNAQIRMARGTGAGHW